MQYCMVSWFQYTRSCYRYKNTSMSHHTDNKTQALTEYTRSCYRYKNTSMSHHTDNKTQALTATAAGVCRWMMQRMSGRAWWMAECRVKPALLMPSPVEPVSTISPRTSTFTRVLAVISEYNMPKGLTRNCSCS